jgi:hypothetical protein
MRNRFHWDESDVVITRAGSVDKHYGGGHDQKTHGNRGGRSLGLVNSAKAKPGEFKGSKRLSSPMRLVGEDGSYYDYIDFDDPDYHPVQQLLDMAADSLPLEGDIELVEDLDDIDVELFAEQLDGFQAISEMFPGVTIRNLVYQNLGAGAGGNASYATRNININSSSIMKGSRAESFERGFEASRKSGEFVPSDISASQMVVVHEFGHVVRYKMMEKAPKELNAIEVATIKKIDPKFSAYEAPTSYTDPSFPSMTPASSLGYYTPTAFGSVNTPGSFLADGRVFAGSVTLAGTPSARQARIDKVTKAVSRYASENGHELFAEIFSEAYSRDYKDLRPAARAFYDTFEAVWGAASKALKK